MGDPGCQLLFGETAGTALRKGADLWRMPGRNYRFAYALADGTRVEFHGIDTNGCQGHVRRDHPEQEHVLYQQVALLHERLQASPSAADFGWEAPEERAAALPLVREIFAMFDADGDDKLSKEEYKAYLRGVGAWGTDWYTNEEWDESWPKECEQMKSGTDGIGRESFESILYGKYRVGKAQMDLDKCKECAEVQGQAQPEASEPEPEPEPKPDQAPWKVVFGHHPLHTAGKKHNTIAQCLRKPSYTHRSQEMRGYGLGKVLDDAGVSMYFCGHEHVMQFKKTSGGVAQCVSGAVHGHGYYGGPAYPDTMRAEADWHDDPHGHGFVAARIGSAEAKIEFVRASAAPADAKAGKTLHEVVLPKTPAEGQPPAEPEGSALERADSMGSAFGDLEDLLST